MSANQQRQGFRLSVKKAVDSVFELKTQEQTPDIRDQFARKHLLLTSYLPKLESYDKSVLEAVTDETAIEQEITNTRIFNEAVEEAIVEAQILSTPAASGTFPGSSGGEGSSTPQTSKSLRVKLPKLEIAHFEGDTLKWQEFWDAFESAIHERPDLAPIEKFTYLRGLLTGEALRLVEGYRITDANYTTVTDVLKQHYGDKQAVVFAHIEALLSLPPSGSDPGSLLETYTKLERHLRSLDSLQPGQDMILFSVILSKLPRFLKIEAHRRKGSLTDCSLADLRKWLGEEIHAREMGDRLHRLNVGGHSSAESPFKGNGAARGAKRSGKPGSSTSALVSQSEKLSCPFCGEGHFAEQCKRYPDPDSRRPRLQNRCYLCLGRGHVAKACRNNKPCKFCKRKGHHCSLCFGHFGRPKGTTESGLTNVEGSSGWSEKPKVKPTVKPDNDYSVLLTSDQKRERTVMQTAIAPIESNNGFSAVTARLFFDTGASRSFIIESKRYQLGLPVLRKEMLSVSSFQSSRRTTSEHKIVEFRVKCKDGTTQNVVAAVVPSITCPIQNVALSTEYIAVPVWSLAEPLVQKSEYMVIDVLIGMDFYYPFVTGERAQGSESLWFQSSKLGYLSSGRVSTSDQRTETVAVMLVKTHTDPSPIDLPVVDLTKYWELEEIGMKESLAHGAADEEAVTAFSSVKFQNGRYQVCWPWKTPSEELKDNYGVAHGRLRSLLARFSQSHGLAQSYSDVFKSELETGIIEKAPLSSRGSNVYYMPHHGVHRPNQSTTKLRVVFDASSKARNGIASLNDCLHRGPVLLEDRCGLLLRFRTNFVGLVSDIEKAFLQIGLQESERDVTRFLWVNEIGLPPVGENLVAYRFCRVPFGVISSPFLLGATVAHHLRKNSSPVANKMLQNIYVDNVITGESSPEAAINHYQTAKQILQSASMNLGQWYTNSDIVRNSIHANDQGEDVEPKVLGLRWNTASDKPSAHDNNVGRRRLTSYETNSFENTSAGI